MASPPPPPSFSPGCESLLSRIEGVNAEARSKLTVSHDFRQAFLGQPVEVDTEIGALQIGIIDVDFPGVAETISDILVRSISDARESNARPGHLPDHLVDDVIRRYVSPEKVKTFWRFHGHRFVAMDSKGEIIGSLLLGIDKDTLLYLNRWTNNVPAEAYPGIKPAGYHQMLNLSVRHDMRRSKVASVMLDTVTRHFRHLFNGKGIWMRADPPWHDKLISLGFKHDLSMDSFLPESAEKTSGMSHSQYNTQFRCSCHPENPIDLSSRDRKMLKDKLQYFSFTRGFDPPPPAQPRGERQVDVLILGGGISGTSFALKLREINPKLKTLIVSRDGGFALSGHGHLYPMTEMEQFRFPGDDSIQPTVFNGKTYPGEVERALVANQGELNVWNGEIVDHLNSDGSVLLKSGLEIHARAIVVATGMTAIHSDIVDESAQSKVKDFLTLSREIAQLPYVNRAPGSWGTVAILGDGAGGRALAHRLRNDVHEVAKAVLLIGENASNETVTKIVYMDNKFDVEVRDQSGNPHHYSADRVVINLGYDNTGSQRLAAKLKTDLIIGAGAFQGSAPPIVRQIEALSTQAEQLNSKLNGAKQ